MKTKRITTIILSMLCALSLAACGGNASSNASKNTEIPPREEFISSSDIDNVYASPDNYTGKWIELTGKVFGGVDSGEFQMWQDIGHLNNNTVVYFDTASVGIVDDDYVRIVGKINGSVTGENALGGRITALSISAASVEKVSYIDAAVPTIKTITPDNAEITQHGCTIRIDKIECAEKETRLYVTAENNSDYNMTVHEYSSNIVQGKKQIEKQTNFDGDYPEFPMDILPGVECSAIIPFAPIDPDTDLKVVINSRNDNYRLRFNDYVFSIAAN